MKIAVLFFRLGPYHHVRLRSVAPDAKVVGLELFGSDDYYEWDKKLVQAGCPQRTLFPDDSAQSRAKPQMKRRVYDCLDEEKPDVVAIAGWGEHGMLCALSWCVDRGVPAVVMSDSHDLFQQRPAWKEWGKSKLVQCFSAALCAGTPQADYLRKLGIPSSAIFPGFDVVDNEHFRAGSEAVRANAAAVRAQLRLPWKYFLVVGRFSPEKNLDRLLNAYAAYCAEAGSRSWDLVLVGSGPLRDAVEGRIKNLGLGERVLLRGFAQYDELPNYYGLGGALVFPSLGETWGLVVNEAMASGLPVLISNRCGCVPDLLREGVNGWTFDPFETGAITQAMVRMSDGSCDVAAMGVAAQATIQQWPLQLFGRSLRAAAEVAMKHGRPQPGLVARCLLP